MSHRSGFRESKSFFALFPQVRSSHPEVFCKKGVLRNFLKFTGKHLCQSLFSNKVAGLVCNFIKRETLAQVFSCEFCEISRLCQVLVVLKVSIGLMELDKKKALKIKMIH